MDRALMEGNPHSVLEGLLIGAYAIGATAGYVYVRQEYPLAVKNLGLALRQAEEFGLLGKGILGSGLEFTVKVHRGAGAFVCGEETALLRSLEGRPGEPTPRPPYPAVRGLWGQPTNINNVETWANVPLLIGDGAAAFAAIGTEASKGTKIFSLVGKIAHTGLVEVPMGIRLREIVYDIGGGIPDGKAFKAVQTGGPSGGCIPAECLDEPVDFDRLTELGSMMGSGGMIVMDEDTCMVSVAKYFLQFLKEESCGKCTPCREGIAQMLDILSRVTRGEGRAGDLEALESLGALLEDTSLCALGKTAAYPALSTVRRFREEYQAHIASRRCPAKVCPGLFRYSISAEVCTGCGLCAKKCPVEGIGGQRKQPHVIDQVKCTHCGSCFEVCPFSAVVKL
jgi:NADH-quinone oxidoreductase subunit F